MQAINKEYGNFINFYVSGVNEKMCLKLKFRPELLKLPKEKDDQYDRICQSLLILSNNLKVLARCWESEFVNNSEYKVLMSKRPFKTYYDDPVLYQMLFKGDYDRCTNRFFSVLKHDFLKVF